MKSTLTFFLSIVIASAALAEPITVRSGEHLNFTRLVLQLPENAEWELENELGSSKLTFDNYNEGFDLTSAFDIIPRTRLAALLARPSQLEMQLACNCQVSAFVEDGGFLVLDISESSEEIEESSSLIENMPLPRSEFEFGELLWGQTTNTEQYVSENNEAPQSEVDKSNKENQQDLANETRYRLLKSFSSAASQGLLTQVEGLIIEQVEIDENSPNFDIFDSSELEVQSNIQIEGNMRISDSKDVPNNTTSENLNLSGSACPDPKLVDIPSWATDEPFYVQIAASNRHLFDEVGRISTKQIIDRARLYLSFGFGAEAKKVLQLGEGLERKYPELLDLANIMEFGYLRNPRFIHHFPDCPSPFSLWAILSAEQITQDTPIDTAAALRALSDLPEHLKFFVGQELSKRLLEYGDIQSAEIAIRSYKDLKENTSDNTKLVEADVLRKKGESDKAAGMMNDIISAGSSETPQALLSKVEHYYENDLIVNADDVLLAESYAFQFRDLEGGQEFLRTFVLAAALSHQYERSLDAILSSELPFTTEVKKELAEIAFSELVEEKSDARFLSIFFEYFQRSSDLIGHGMKMEIGKRLLDLGFIDHVEGILDATIDYSESSNYIILRAWLLYFQHEYSDSIALLEYVDSDEAARIRGLSLERLGAQEAAAREFNQIDMTERANAALWMANNWDSLVDPHDQQFGSFLKLSTESLGEVSNGDQMLRESELAIASSSSARDSLRTSLEALEISR